MLSSCYGARVWLPPRPESGDSQSVLNLRNARKPDVAIVDSQVLGTNGAELASKIKRLAPVVGRSIFTNSPASIPNRLLIWGGFSLPWKMRVLPMLSIDPDFPTLCGMSARIISELPIPITLASRVFSLSTRACSKRFRSPPNIRSSSRSEDSNLTNRFNPLAVHANTGDPQLGTLFGSYKRRFQLDFDVLF